MGVHNLEAKDTFDAQVVNGSGVAVVDFFATWCGPCKMIAPTIVKMSEKYENVSFYKVDVDQTPVVAQEYGIRAMPTFLIFKDGQKVDEVVGANARDIEEKVQKALA